jgi:hypothetical protein
MPADTARELRRLQARTANQLYSLMNGVRTRRLTPQQATGQARTLFRVSHALAALYGVQRGGGSGEVRRAVADRAAKAEMEFLRGMIADAKAGRYARRSAGGEGAKALRARATLYSLKLVGTANSAYVASLEEGAVIRWVLGSAESCEVCPVYAAGGPYTRATLPAVPGDGSTPCVTQCRCHLETAAGSSFANA